MTGQHRGDWPEPPPAPWQAPRPAVRDLGRRGMHPLQILGIASAAIAGALGGLWQVSARAYALCLSPWTAGPGCQAGSTIHLVSASAGTAAAALALILITAGTILRGNR